jgi:PAS domain S-box-containing protein
MNLRSILKILALLAFLSAAAAGFLYYSMLKEYALREAERQARDQIQTIGKNVSASLSQNVKTVITLAGMEALSQALLNPNGQTLAKANAILDHFKKTLQMDVCYLMTQEGITIASSNRQDEDSFVGLDFSFRPYFQQAIQGIPWAYLALGTTSGKRGLYDSYPVFAPLSKTPIGVAVIKASLDFIEHEMSLSADNIIMITDPRGIIFISNKPEWLFQSAWKLNSLDLASIAEERQFGDGPWMWVGLEKIDPRHVKDQGGNRYLLHSLEIDNYPGWHVVRLQDLHTIAKIYSDPLIKITGPIVMTVCLLIIIAVFFLYRKANSEIHQRLSAEKALQESEARYRSLYHNTPAMLHSIGPDGCILSVSDYWTEILGYRREEVIGRRISDFLTPDSRRYADEIVIPEFFKTGICKDIAYQFVKRSGEVIDVLISATSERDAKAKSIRSLAVSMDVTERKKAEKELRAAKEELSQYSKNLERQVRNRTREITSLLQYTPAVVYMKDLQGRYMLVNPRYEDLFGTRTRDVRGRTDDEILPRMVAEQFRAHDRKVFEDKQSFQVEELIAQNDGMHTYLSVKFPTYDESGAISGVGGIATDITDLKKAQDQLRRLSGSIMASQEKERAYIARELHDELGQVLTALHMDVVWIQNRFKSTDKLVSQRAAGMCQLIDQTVEEVRSMSRRLRPGVLDHLGLLDALEWYTADFERRTRITCFFEHHRVPLIDGAIATAFYRIVQEALTNVARHSSASRVEVSLKVDQGVLTLSVADNGQGFGPEILSRVQGLGVAGMRERATLLGGNLTVTSRPNEGTRIDLTVPLNGQPA